MDDFDYSSILPEVRKLAGRKAILLLGTDCHVGEELNQQEQRVGITPQQVASLRTWLQKSGVFLDFYFVQGTGTRAGFSDGDYLEAGGTGQPPAMPPRRYWKAVYQSPEGRLAVQDWYRGFAYGAEMAKASGYRQLVTIPLSDALTWTTEPFYERPRMESDAGDGEEAVDGPTRTAPSITRLPPRQLLLSSPARVLQVLSRKRT